MTRRHAVCPHTPTCPEASAPDREAARTIISHPEQGWSLLCNGIVIFEDTGELLPDGDAIGPHRPPICPCRLTPQAATALLPRRTRLPLSRRPRLRPRPLHGVLTTPPDGRFFMPRTPHRPRTLRRP